MSFIEKSRPNIFLLPIRVKGNGYNPPMMSSSASPRISIVIPNFNGAAYLEKCLASLKLQTYAPLEILVVENASTDGSADVIRHAAPDAQILHQSRNLGFAGGANAGILHARGEWIAILNNDTEASAAWLAECAAAIERHPEAAFLACRISDISRRNIIYSAGDCILRAGIGYRRGQQLQDCEGYGEEIEIFSACGCAALYRKSALKDTGGYDDHFFAYCEDVDLGLRLQAAGYCGYYIPRAEVFHYGAGTSGGEMSALAVRLTTRNSILLLVKSVPARILWKCLPMVIAAQASWLCRVILRHRVFSYGHGLIGILPLVPAMLRERKKMRRCWRRSADRLWKSVLTSETLAREDFVSREGVKISSFLKWYFRVF
jgi:GT2 family glycosyltransferase